MIPGLMGHFHVQPSEIYNMDGDDFHFFGNHLKVFIREQNKGS